jgi:carbonic anhydrase
MVQTLIKGTDHFRRGYFNKNRDKFIDLVENGQRPEVLFITCADSRVVPHAMTNSDPGDLFVLRNVGNMVPAFNESDSCNSTGSAIEYAVSVLEVSEIIVCGHSHCGACAALFSAHYSEELTLTKKWLAQGQAVRDLILEEAATDFDQAMPIFRSRDEQQELLRATEKAMVVQHLSNLMTYPSVARRVEAGQLRLHGWYYALERGSIESYDPQKLAFVPVTHPQPQSAQQPVS